MTKKEVDLLSLFSRETSEKDIDTGGPPVRSPPVGRISLQDCFEISFFYYTVSCSAIFMKVSSKHSLYETVKFTATYLKCVSALDFPLRAAWAGHWLLGRPKQL